MAGESPSLLSTTERFQHGLFYTGMSSGADHGHDSADHLFFHMDKGGGKASKGSATVDAVTLHRHVDYYFQPGDRYGERESNQLNWLNNPQGGELMLQRRLEADLISYIMLSEYDKETIIARLHKRGIYTAPNGKPLEEYLVTTKPANQDVDFGPCCRRRVRPGALAPRTQRTNPQPGCHRLVGGRSRGPWLAPVRRVESPHRSPWRYPR